MYFWRKVNCMNILIPTDLSEASLNSLPAVIQLFKKNPVTITLFHSVEPRTGGSTLVLNVDDIIYEEAKVQLEDFIKDLEERYKDDNVTIKSEIAFGYFEPVLNRVLDRTHPDLIIMTSKSREGVDKIFERKQTLKFIGELKQPFLVIPYEEIPEEIKLIGVAIDQKEPPKPVTVEKIETLANKISAELELFHVYNYNEGDLSFYDKKVANTGKMSQEIELIVNDKVAVGMEEWMKTHNADMLTLITHNKNFLSKLLTPGMTRVMAKRNSTMLLIITQ